MLRRSIRSVRSFRHTPSETVETTDPLAAGPDLTAAATELTDDAQLAGGPVRAEVSRRAQHERRPAGRGARALEPGRQAGPKVGLVALGLSALAVAALTVGTVQGLRHDGATASAAQDQAMLTLARQAAALPDGRQEDVADSRAATQAAAVAAQQRAAAAAAAAAAAQKAAAAQRAQQAAQAARAAQAAAAAAQARQQTAAQASRSAVRTGPVAGGSAQAIAQSMLAQRGWSGQWSCLNSLWQRESGWNYRASNPSSGAYGIPQALPGSKMASAGADWATNPATQISWGLSYIASTYGTPCSAWAHSQATGWY